MFKAAIITKYGDSNVFKIKKVNLRELKTDEVALKHEFIGVNYHDIKQRSGNVKKTKLPLVVGCEGVGTIEAVGPMEQTLKVGDRVCYINTPYGAYSEKRIINSKYLLPIHNTLSSELLAGSLHKIAMAHSLMFKVFSVKKDMTILVHNVCGSIGCFIVQIGKIIGCKVIGTVASDEQVKTANQLGCQLALNYNNNNVAQTVLEFTNGKGVPVVYDSIGGKTSNISLNSLSMFGLYVVYEQNCGIVQDINWNSLNARSLFYAAPSFFYCKNDPIERMFSVAEIFNLLLQKKIITSVAKKYSLEEAGKAQDDYEQGLEHSGIIAI